MERAVRADAPAWAKGYDVADLKRYAELFKRAHKPHVYGAFGLVKERDIAEALVHDRFALAEAGTTLRAAAIFRHAVTASKQRDFSGRAFDVLAGDTYVSAFAALDATPGYNLLRDVTADRKCWVEIFEEDTVAKAVVEALSLNYMFTKVMAGSEIKGVYTNFLRAGMPVDFASGSPETRTLEVVRKGYFRQATLSLIQRELVEVSHLWAQHYSSYNKRGTWTSFALRGYDKNDPTFIIKPAEMAKSWQRDNFRRLDAMPQDTQAMNMFPTVVSLLGYIPAKYDRVRFMRLAATKGELTRHADITDRGAGVADGKVMRLHIPIVTNPDVHFYGWDARGNKLSADFAPGDLFYLDQRKPHCVRNEGGTDRIHLVIDAFATPRLREWLFHRHNYKTARA